MEEKKQSNNKKQLILTIVGVLTLVIAVVGATYAAWNYVFNGTLTNTITTNDISLDLLESDDEIINITNALPMSYSEGKAQTETFDFAVTSETVKDIDIEYNINIQKLEIDAGYTALKDYEIALYLTDYNDNPLLNGAAPEHACEIYNDKVYGHSGEELEYSEFCSACAGACQTSNYGVNDSLKPMMLNNSNSLDHVQLVSQLNNYKLYTGTHSHDRSHNKVQDKFKLRVWIDQKVDATSWNASTKLQYKFKIGLTSTEKQRRAYPEYVYRWGTNIVNIGDSLVSVTGTKWIITDGNQDVPAGPYETQSECQTKLVVFGSPPGFSCQQKTGTFGGFDYTEDYTTLNKTYFLGHKIGIDGKVERNDACFIRNNTLYCLKGVETANAGYNSSNPAPYYQENYNTLLEAFGPNAIENEICFVYDSGINCSASDLAAGGGMSGDVGAEVDSVCNAESFGTSNCSD